MSTTSFAPYSFTVWAPKPSAVRLIVDGSTIDMDQAADGFWTTAKTPVPGQRYGYSLKMDDGSWSSPFPDPRSQSQPDGVHGQSEVTDPKSFTFTDDEWTGVGLAGQVIYELHVGTFTPEGTFAALEKKLDYLKDTGVTAIEIMPVQPFGGNRNWGYDGVLWHAVHAGYGGPDGLKSLVNAAHKKGIAVILDVVYNHFGPDGNYNCAFAPYTAGGDTGWGDLINLFGAHSDNVRAYITDAVRMWLEDFHIDGLRLDAVHAYHDPGAYNLLEELQDIADEVSATTGRHKFLIAESDQNDPRLTAGRGSGGFGLEGQWLDDIHHALHTLVSGEQSTYYADFGTTDVLAKTLRQVFFHDGSYSSYRGRRHGRKLDTTVVPASRFVTYTTTHDQTGNRAAGDRPSMNLSPEKQVLKAAVIYFSPFTPMLFMGEEYGADTPFPFFCSHTDEELNRLTNEGRHREFASHGWDSDDVPLPSAKETFESAKLDWSFTPNQKRIHEAYKTILTLRRQWRLARPWLNQMTVDCGPDWITMEHDDVIFAANFSDHPVTIPHGGNLIYSFTTPEVGATDTTLDPWGFALIER